MSRKQMNRWIRAAAAGILIMAAVVNAWMMLDEGPTAFRIVATIAFALGGMLLLVAFRGASPSSVARTDSSS